MLKKKELMAIPKLIKQSKSVICQAVAEVLEIDGDEILHIDVNECGEILVRYFADKNHNRWLCYGVNAGWNQMGLESAVDYEISKGDYERFDWGGYRYYSTQVRMHMDSKDQDIIFDYFNAYRMSNPVLSITDWEYSCRTEKRLSAQSRKQERIDETMALVPELPEDFRDWLSKEVFKEANIYVKDSDGKKEYHCMVCNAKGTRKMRAPIGKDIKCPRCGQTVKVRSKDRRYKGKTAAVVLFQPCRLPNKSRDPLLKLMAPGPGYVERQLVAECVDTKEGRDFIIYEDLRAIVPAGHQWGTVYYGEYSAAETDSQMFWDTNPMNKRWRSSYLYPGNLREVLPLAGLEHSGIDILARKNIKVNVNHFLINYNRRPWIEYLIKAGLYNLVRDITDGGTWYEIKINAEGRNLQECLGLDGAGVNRMKQLNGNAAMLAWLKVEKTTGKKISQESMEYLMKSGVNPGNKAAWKMFGYFGSVNKVANYLKKQSKILKECAKSVISTWEDYMSMADRLKMRTDMEMFFKPKDLRAAHDECLALLERQKAGDRADEVRKKYPEAELVLQMAQKYAYVGEEYQIIIPQKIEDIVVEGATLGHCIDRTDIYFDRIQQRTSILAFLRKNNRPDAPWYTLEIEPGGTIRQKRTVKNTQDAEDIKAFTPFLREWQQYVKKMLSDEEKELAKASRETRLREYKELRDKKEPVRNGLLAGKLLADVLEADLMEAM